MVPDGNAPDRRERTPEAPQLDPTVPAAPAPVLPSAASQAVPGAVAPTLPEIPALPAAAMDPTVPDAPSPIVSSPERRARRIPTWASAALLVLAALVVLGTVLVLVAIANASEIASRVSSRMLPEFGRRIGCDVRVSKVSASALPRPSVEIAELVVSCAEQEVPLLVARRVRAQIALLPLLTSWGSDVRLSEIVVEGAAVSVVERTSGRSNLAAVAAAALASAGPRVSLDMLRLQRARIDWFVPRLSPSPVATIDNLALDVALRSGQQGALRLQGSVGASARNLEIEAVIDSRGAATGTFALHGCDVARVRSALPLMSLAYSGELSVSGSFSAGSEGAALAGKGTMRGITLAGRAPGKAAPLQGSFELSAKTAPGADPSIELPVVRFDEFSWLGVRLERVSLQATVTPASIQISKLDAAVAGGSASASARVEVSEKPPKWSARGSLDRLDLPTLVQGVGGRSPLTGTGTVSFDVHGAGLSDDSIRASLSGTGRVQVERASLTQEAAARLIQPIRGALGSLGLPSELVPSVGALAVDPFGGAFRIVNGEVRLVDPLVLRTRMGAAVLSGKIGLDQKLALSGTATLYVSPVPGHGPTVPIAIRGTFSEPVVELASSPGELVRVIAGTTARDVSNELERRLRGWIQPKTQ